MGMAKTLAELKRLSKNELIKLHDDETPNTIVGVGFYREEIARREQEEHADTMLALTRSVQRVTWFIALLTLANLAAVFVSIWVTTSGA